MSRAAARWVWLCCMCALGCDPAGGCGDTRTRGAPPSPTQAVSPVPRPGVRKPVRREPFVVVRARGKVHPALKPRDVVNAEQLITLAREAELVVDGAGGRLHLRGPARFRFALLPHPALLVGQGAFALSRSVGGPRQRPAVVALVEGWVEARGPVQLVGRAGPSARLEVLSGSARIEPAGQVAMRGQVWDLSREGGALSSDRTQGTMEARLSALSSETALEREHADARTRPRLSALRAAFHTFRSNEGTPVQPEASDALSRRRALAERAAARIRARRALWVAFDRYRAARVRSGGGDEPAWVAPIREVLAEAPR